MEAKKLALHLAALAKTKKAQNIVILDMRAVCGFCDYFIILSCTSQRQVNAIAEALKEESAKLSIKSLSRVCANDESGWIVLDFLSVIVHIFYRPLREFYALERLWADAKKLRLPKENGK